MRERYEDDFRAEMGAEAIKELLCEIDLDKLSEELKKELEDTQQGQKRVKLLKDLMLLRRSDSAVTDPNG